MLIPLFDSFTLLLGWNGVASASCSLPDTDDFDMIVEYGYKFKFLNISYLNPELR